MAWASAKRSPEKSLGSLPSGVSMLNRVVIGAIETSDALRVLHRIRRTELIRELIVGLPRCCELVISQPCDHLVIHDEPGRVLGQHRRFHDRWIGSLGVKGVDGEVIGRGVAL